MFSDTPTVVQYSTPSDCWIWDTDLRRRPVGFLEHAYLVVRQFDGPQRLEVLEQGLMQGASSA